MKWQDASSENQSPNLLVIQQLVSEDEIFAQIWQHEEDGNISYSMNTFEDPTNLDGKEHHGSFEDLVKIAEDIFK